MFKKRLAICSLAVASFGFSSATFAYYTVYGSYVEYGETEVELYGHYVDDKDKAVDGEQQYVLEVGKGIRPNLFVEAKAEFEKRANDSVEMEAVALEAIYQVTEQGEYDWNMALLGEIEYNVDKSEMAEIEFGPILSTDISDKLYFTTNIIAEYEVQEEKMEGKGNAQLKWRLSQRFEPSIELYASEYSTNIGPVVSGKLSQASGNKIGYEFGWLVGVDDQSADNTVKFMLEYEFY